MLILLEVVLFGSMEFKQHHSFYLKLRILQIYLDPVLKKSAQSGSSYRDEHKPWISTV